MSGNSKEPQHDSIEALIAIMATLRDPESGCPWDLKQNFRSIAPYTIEEAYEVADAIERGNAQDIKEELGDLLLQVVFHARMAQEQDLFSFSDVVKSICEKMIRRHPHIFGNEKAADAGAVKLRWDEIKAAEKLEKGGSKRLLDDIPATMPALTRAVKLQGKAAKVGFDWPGTREVLEKLSEETAELIAELDTGSHPDRVEEEFGDLLFVYANLARHLKVDPEAALRRTNAKFMSRFAHIEDALALDRRTPQQSTLEEMDALWNEAKKIEKARVKE